LRELISNASDAMDKIQFQATTSPEKLAMQPELYIRVSADKEARTITVEDAGIGLTRQEMINNLGTIARSGTKAFMEAATVAAQDGDLTMIGQFGVGFYSAYLVSEKVTVVSKSIDDEQHIWDSTAGGTFTVQKDEDFKYGKIKRGTKVICSLKDDQLEFLNSTRIKDLILKHSAFVGFPIEVYMEHREEESVADSEEKAVTITHKWELINKNKPVWLRDPEEVTHEEYAELYKWLASDWEDHLGVKHVVQNGQIVFKALLYCPRNAPKDMFDMGKMAQRFSIRLYVRRVFIKEFNDLIPKWMGFIKGIVDSDDMPLNISREQLQQNAILYHIKTSLVKNIFQMFTDLAKNPAVYAEFYESFAQCLKLGVYEDHTNRSAILPLLRYYSTKSGDQIVSFEEYIARMKPGQNHILYINGRTKRDASKSPYIEGLKKDGYEVLYMIDPVDEYALQFIKDYDGYSLMNCQNVDVLRVLNCGRSLDDLKKELEPVRILIEKSLQGQVSSVAWAEAPSQDALANLSHGNDALPRLDLNVKHTLLKELEKRGAREDSIMSDMAALLLDSARVDGDDARLQEVCTKCQALIMTVSAGEQDDSPEDLPSFGSSMEDTVASTFKSCKDWRKELPDCGDAVRVNRGDRSQRALVSYVDDDAHTVDVMYPLASGGDEEEEGLPRKKIQKLLDFELEAASEASLAAKFKESLFQTATTIKDQGNQLFKLKDYDAAAERYFAVIEAFRTSSRSQGQKVLHVTDIEGKQSLATSIVMSVDRDGVACELSSGVEVAMSSTLPVFAELLPLQTSVHMNRARCLQNLDRHRDAAQDLTVVLALWRAADKRMLDADPEMKEAESKGLYTAMYLRAKARLARGLLRQASQDIKDALALSPPQATVKQLRELKTEVQKAQEEYRRVNAPLSKELAKVKIALGGGPRIS